MDGLFQLDFTNGFTFSSKEQENKKGKRSILLMDMEDKDGWGLELGAILFDTN